MPLPSPLWYLGWRALVLLVGALWPWGAPLEAATPASHDAAMWRAIAGWVLLAALLGALVQRLDQTKGRDRAAWLALAATACATVASAALPRGTWPLGAALVVVGPLVWAALALAVARAAGPTRRKGALTTLLVLAVVSVVAGVPRLKSRAATWESVLATDPASAAAHAALLALARARGAPADEVRRLVERCTRDAPAVAACQRERAEDALRRGALDVAAAASAAVLRAEPRDARAAVVRAEALARSRPRDDEALAAARRAVEVAPSAADAHAALARVLDARGATREALAAARAAQARGASDDDALLLTASLALRENDDAAARAAVDALLRRAPEHADGLYNLGLLEHRAGRYNRAREAYLRALRASPRHYAARHNLARLTLAAGVFDEARHHAQRLIELDARDPRGIALVREIDARSDAARATPDGGAAPTP